MTALRRIALTAVAVAFVAAWRIGGARLSRGYVRALTPFLDRLVKLP